MLLNILGISCGYADYPVIKDASFQIKKGDLIGIVGPNGSGKSTLLRTISRVLKPSFGKVLLEEQDIYQIPAAKFARRLAVVPQESGFEFAFTVEDVVMMGRIPHLKRFQKESTKDRKIVYTAMNLTDTDTLAHRHVNELSGGEKQRVLIARALAQEPGILLLDEPTSFLDLKYQIEIMELLTRLRNEQGLTIILVIHDLNLASQFCDRLLVLKEGKIYATGSPSQIITAELINEVYGCKVKVESRTPQGRPILIFHPTVHCKQENKQNRVHVVGGGGAGTELFGYLIDLNWKVSTGVINIGDSDWQQARQLGIDIVEAGPFCEIGEEELLANRKFMKQSDFIILADVPFGTGNIRNLEMVLEEVKSGAPVIVINRSDISKRDYTGGKATEIYYHLLESGVTVVESEWEAINLMKEGQNRCHIEVN